MPRVKFRVVLGAATKAVKRWLGRGPETVQEQTARRPVTALPAANRHAKLPVEKIAFYLKRGELGITPLMLMCNFKPVQFRAGEISISEDQTKGVSVKGSDFTYDHYDHFIEIIDASLKEAEASASTERERQTLSAAKGEWRKLKPIIAGRGKKYRV